MSPRWLDRIAFAHLLAVPVGATWAVCTRSWDVLPALVLLPLVGMIGWANEAEIEARRRARLARP